MENINQKNNKINPLRRAATIKFFIIMEKDKPMHVLPGFLNFKYISKDEINRLKVIEVLISSIKIPPEPKPWSEISDKADVVFLALQSRRDWGQELDEASNLLKVDKIRDMVERFERSINRYSFTQDFQSGKFESPEKLETPEIKAETSPEREIGEDKNLGDQGGVTPGEGWKV